MTCTDAATPDLPPRWIEAREAETAGAVEVEPEAESPTVGRFGGSILLLQVRDRPIAARHEHVCFLERLGVGPDRLDALNLLDEPVPSWERVRDHDLVILGGAGAHSAIDDDAFTRPLLRLVRRIVDAGRPFFGSCFGHQFMVRALGGSVLTDPVREEIGTYQIELTAAGRDDPLFGTFPDRFPVHLGHHDRVDRLPTGVHSLAFSKRCEHQAIRVGDLPVYGTQFHSEMSAEHMRERLRMYAESYLPAEDPGRVLERRVRPTVEVERLLGRYVGTFLSEERGITRHEL